MVPITASPESLLAPRRGACQVALPRAPSSLGHTYAQIKSSKVETRATRQDQERLSTSGRSQGGKAAGSKQFPFAPIAGLAAAGFAETAYLTIAKLTESPIACPLSGGCASVLTSDYAMLFGRLPLSAAGMAAYGAVSALAAAGLRAVQRKDEDAEASLRAAVMAGGVLLSSTTAYLLYVLATAFPGELCPWCITSAALSAGIALLGASAVRRRELEEGAMPGAGLAAATLLTLSLAVGNPDSIQAGTGVTELEYKQPVVTAQSPPEAAALARRLRDAGARMYGAFWCSHCYEQKQSFGKEAMAAFPYVECFPEGWRQGMQMAAACKEADLKGFPTWVVNGERLEGEQRLGALQAALERAPAAVDRGGS